jgi:hypothetical protein
MVLDPRTTNHINAAHLMTALKRDASLHLTQTLTGSTKGLFFCPSPHFSRLALPKCVDCLQQF